MVGAGPAGSSLANAFLLHGGTGLALIDRATFPRDKSCGDGLGGGVLDVLERLELSGIVANRRRITRMDLHYHDRIHVDLDTAELERPSPLGHIVARHEFDHALLEATRERGATDLTGWDLKDASLVGGQWRLTLERGTRGETREITCDVLVGADGARSRVRRALGIAFDDDDHTAIALRAYVDTPVRETGFQRLDFVKGMPYPGYAWLFSDGHGRANIGFGVLVSAWRKEQRKLPALLDRYRGYLGDQAASEPQDIASAILPTGFWRVRVGFPQQRAALVGDAASMINPGSGEGIFYAMYAGMILGEGLARAGSGDPSPALAAYERDVKREFGRNFRDAWLLMKLLTNLTLLEFTMRDFRASPDFCCDFIEFLMGVMPPARPRSLASLAWRAVTARFAPHGS